MASTTEKSVSELQAENARLRQEVTQAKRIHRMWEKAVEQLKTAREKQNALEKELKSKIDDLQRVRAHLEEIALTDKIIIDNLHEGVVITDSNATIKSVNPSFCRICGYDETELIGQPMSMHKSDVHDDDYYRDMWQQLHNSGSWQGECCNLNKQGEPYYVLYSISAIRDWNMQVIGYTAVALDITQRKRNEEILKQLAVCDELTSLSNRHHFNEELKRNIQLAERYQYRFGLLFIDLDGFKPINDQYGHEAGDAVLVEVARRLVDTTRETDLVARFGGDEFVIIASRILDCSETRLLAERIINRFSEPVVVGDLQLTIGCSIGISIYPDHGNNMESVLQAADQAMYAIKSSGKNAYRLADL